MEVKAGEFLEQINYPSDLKKFKEDDLERICTELRQFIVDTVSVNGGHFGSSLGVWRGSFINFNFSRVRNGSSLQL
jgi:1-deoxy-D-xylulose-5-phosphate synthase